MSEQCDQDDLPPISPPPEDTDDSGAWLCDCGHWQEDAFHCDLCGAEPPWGCACCEDADWDDDYDEDFYP